MVESHHGATIVVINVQGFPLFLGSGSDYIRVGLSLCDLTAASFFLFHLFLSYPWFTTTGPLALLLSNRAQVFMLAVPSFPPLFPCLWFLQLYGSLTALSLIEILFTKVDNLTKHCFFNPLVLIPHFQRYHLSLKSYGCHSLVSKETLHVTTLSTVSGMDVLPKTRGSRTKTVWNSTVANGLWSH